MLKKKNVKIGRKGARLISVEKACSEKRLMKREDREIVNNNYSNNNGNRMAFKGTY